MTNGHFDFEVKGVNYSLHFGNLAVEQFYLLSAGNIESKIAGGYKALTDVIFSGLYNSALIEGRNMPKYKDAVEIFDTLLDEDRTDLLKEIEDVFMNSRATVKQLEAFKTDEKKKKE